MQKPSITTLSITTAVTLLAAGMMLPSGAKAQQTSPSSTQSAPAAGSPQTPAAKAQTDPAKKTPTTAAKPSQAAGAKKPGTAAKGQAPLTLKTQKDKASYAIGLNIGKSMHRDSVDIDPAILVRGIKDALAGAKSLLTDEEARAAITALQAELQKNREEKLKVAGETNKKEGETYLAANKAKEGVVALPSGLQYKILKEGTGPKPTASDTVVCNYQGTLIDGKEFDSSYKRGQPATFPVGGVIRGWTEALQLMPVGSKWQLFIPSELAYGERGAGADIGPNSALIFEVELLSIQEKTPPPQPATPDAAKPDAPKPEATKPETAKPESKPETKPEAPQPKPN